MFGTHLSPIWDLEIRRPARKFGTSKLRCLSKEFFFSDATLRATLLSGGDALEWSFRTSRHAHFFWTYLERENCEIRVTACYFYAILCSAVRVLWAFSVRLLVTDSEVGKKIPHHFRSEQPRHNRDRFPRTKPNLSDWIVAIRAVQLGHSEHHTGSLKDLGIWCRF